MSTSVHITATPHLKACQPQIEASLRCFQDRLNVLPPDEVQAVVDAATRALSQPEEPVPAMITALTGGHRFSAGQRVEAEFDILLKSFALRRELLDGALTTSQVATLLGTSRQTPHDRVESGTLLAVMDRGALRFPPWQFDPEGPDGVVAGLPAVIRALDIPPLSKVAWLTRPNAMLDGETPLTYLKAGHVQCVVGLAQAVGVV